MATGTSRGITWLGTWVGVFALVVCASGCARQSEVVLCQPFAPPSQQELRLTSRWAFSTVDSGRRNCLLAFPLPRAKDGPRDFLLYLSAPNDRGRFHVNPEHPASVRGFLVQAVGDLKGKTTLTDGTIAVRGVWLKPRWLRLDLALRCDDGAAISGRVFLQDAPAEVHSFERQYAADIALLMPGTSQPTESKAGTDPRRSGRP